MGDVQAVAHLETVVDLGGHCHWCDDPLEPGEVVWRRSDTGKRVHEEGCLDRLKEAARPSLSGNFCHIRSDSSAC